MDSNDLYDYEIKRIGLIWKDLMRDWSRKQNTKSNLQEFANVAHHKFLDAGFVVNIMWENNLMINPATMEPFPIEIEVLGRVPGTEGYKEDGLAMFDHEKKRHEVLRSKERGEKFHGEKGTVST